MCRSTTEAGNRKNVRCPSCDNPEKRRARQNLAYHLNKTIGMIKKSHNSSDITANAPTIELLREEKPTTEENFRNSSSEMESLKSLISKEDREELLNELTSLVTDYREKTKSLSNNDWLKQNSENTPSEEISEREREVTGYGALISMKIEQTAGMTYQEAFDEYHSDVQDRIKDLTKQISLSTARFFETMHKYKLPRTPEQEAELDSIDKENTELVNQRDALRKNSERSRAEIIEKFQKATREVLAEIRPYGGTVNIDCKKVKMGKLFQQTVNDNMPTEWIESSNNHEGGKLLVDQSVKRAHYMERKVITNTQTVVKTEKLDQCFFKYNNGMDKPHPEDDLYKGWEYNEDTGYWEGEVREVPEYIHLNYNKIDEDGLFVPEGRGWVKGKIYQDGEITTSYYRAVKVREENYEARPYIRVNAQYKNHQVVNITDFRQVSSHEFSHHMEKCRNKIPYLEEAFLRRRTTDDTGQQEPLVRYKAGKSDEMVREDNFVNVYMGKEYKNSNYREVLSTGTEAIFEGSFGSLLGLDHRKTPDHDMRNFVLGLYATQ